MDPKDKFEWLKAVAADSRFTDGQKVVLMYCAAICVRYGRTTFCVRQETLAERCATTRKSVGVAVRTAKRLGYLSVDRDRQRGRGHHGADEHRLILPENVEPSGDIFSEIGNRTGHEYVTGRFEIGNRTEAATSENATPIRSLQGFLKGAAFRAEKCQEHANDSLPSDNCEACRIANCPTCDGHHYVLGPDRTPIEPGVKCKHEEAFAA